MISLVPRSRVRSGLAVKLAGVLLAFLGCSVTHAVQLSADESGQVLLVPYYTVRNGFVTSLSVVNQSATHSKAVKVRFREGLIGGPVLDLNLYLGSRDVWTASLAEDGNGARLFSTDLSCTYPQIPVAGLAFSNRFYTGQVPGTIDDGGGATLDRTREGYIEIFEMGVLADKSDEAASPSTAQGQAVSAAIGHVRLGENAGTPVDCSMVRRDNPFTSAGDLRKPAGALSGSAILIQSTTGSEFVLPLTALQRFFEPQDATADLFTNPGSLLPDLTSVNPARSDVLVINPGRDDPAVLTVLDWVAAGGQPIDAVSAVLAREGVAGDFDVSPEFRSEWVMTMPTKRYYTLPASNPAPSGFAASSPFQAPFVTSTSQTGAVLPATSCDQVFLLGSSRRQSPYHANTRGVEIFPGTNPPPPKWCAATSSLVFATKLDGPNFTNPAASIFKSAYPDYYNTIWAWAGPYDKTPGWSGWLMAHPAHPDSPTSPGPGQYVYASDSLITLLPKLVSVPLNAGGVRGLAPVHTDGIARRYRGLPVIGFAAVQAITGGQGYGGAFRLRSIKNF